jgi:GrpB-like predicted nucleotidyltransferase (UPF0157 family)
VATFEEITRHGDLAPDIEWVGRPLPLEPIAVVDPDPQWATHFNALAGRIRSTLGVRVLDLQHVGSTSIPDLPAKPVIDICLTVEDSSDEAAYVPALERIGFALWIREPSWHQHRCLVAMSPRAILHVWSCDSPGAIRHRMFRDWLRERPDDRRRYAEAKRESAVVSNALGEDVFAYNQRKQPVIREIMDCMFRFHGMM